MYVMNFNLKNILGEPSPPLKLARGRGNPQGKDDIHLYVWLESQNRKDSNMVASALKPLFSFLLWGMSWKGIKGCACFQTPALAKTRTSMFLAMLAAMRKQKFPQLSSAATVFLPADRAFGRIEQDIRKQNTILLPDDYVAILAKHGNVHVYGTEWKCRDFKAAATAHCKSKRFLQDQ